MLAADIAEHLCSALQQIESVLGDLKQRGDMVDGKKNADAAKQHGL